MSVNIYDKEKGELIKIAGNANGNATIDDASSSNKTTYSSSKIEELINNSSLTFATDEEVEQAIQAIIDSYEGRN